ncbi:hypothetical protein TraAM80_08226 [Trypanosoma rangeli]|uniref:Uncharacterized protein n=1 Tax=Trypanosoma rangeli TaxID=5698 RepID=A0A422N1U5_TRYRA|nr:uncharacterized protein TraAM80_08226 [Trypanosoma rangeli]RNE99435.1 hypothetical protein TraAM80_08226 [Trypanosoma rangeli]|eukprot:RNE99435.1 hypothetical protein TraAM80_08226 [Trypanosoma rangeli]
MGGDAGKREGAPPIGPTAGAQRAPGVRCASPEPELATSRDNPPRSCAAIPRWAEHLPCTAGAFCAKRSAGPRFQRTLLRRRAVARARGGSWQNQRRRGSPGKRSRAEGLPPRPRGRALRAGGRGERSPRQSCAQSGGAPHQFLKRARRLA